MTYSQELDDLLSLQRPAKKATYIDGFHDMFLNALTKFTKHVDLLPAKEIYSQNDPDQGF